MVNKDRKLFESRVVIPAGYTSESRAELLSLALANAQTFVRAAVELSGETVVIQVTATEGEPLSVGVRGGPVVHQNV